MITIIEELDRSGARLATGLAALTDAEVRGPSALPGWSRGHVISHLSRSIDAYRWMLAVAHTGTEPGPRPGSAELAHATEAGAGRPAAELAAELREQLARLTADAAALPADRWEVLVSALAGWRHPAWYTLNRCWRELETHHVDLDLGYRPADWPAAYVAWALDDTATALAARAFPLARIEATDLDRSWNIAAVGPTATGPGHTLLGWLSGRATPDAAALGVDGAPLPAPPAWPLPAVTWS
ncbi:maleylpyruvate isomerase family mycothiol-dependent enzyme [Kitasatospora sp. NBC_01250]|uniref:maleylpyruvate isomerase family mycothiol-dependent enzyme n=1 Tax=unclassified Kitasatospora TaxID=2633591 RepID=UPI002E160BC6|nr:MULTISPECIES: maleylpyruvate isomerase family mycothiol-dependent enzyme [unclassified Kitasatospora]WSJ70914.1 maleylpyruvate isomerase family mycothiol-dependent enzyme [Kitasatospora sp. NBC_01302]